MLPREQQLNQQMFAQIANMWNLPVMDLFKSRWPGARNMKKQGKNYIYSSLLAQQITLFMNERDVSQQALQGPDFLRSQSDRTQFTWTWKKRQLTRRLQNSSLINALTAALDSVGIHGMCVSIGNVAAHTKYFSRFFFFFLSINLSYVPHEFLCQISWAF